MEILEKLFTENTTSIHIKSNNNVLAKVGTPGNWQLITLDYKFSKEELTNIINDILKKFRVFNRNIKRKYKSYTIK